MRDGARGAGACLLAASVVLAGSALVLSRLSAQSLWVDEGITILPVIEASSFADLIHRVRAIDSQPPATHAILYALRRLVPASEFGWRLPSFLATEAGILLLYGWVARRWGRAAGLVTAGLAQVSPFLTFYAMEARNYALWFFAVVASFSAMSRWWEAVAPGDPDASGPGPADRRRALWWSIVWGAANAFGLWTHLFHLFAMVMQIVLVIHLARSTTPSPAARRRILLSALGAQAAAGALFAPWPLFVLQGSAAVPTGVGWTRSPALASLLYYPFALAFGFSLGPDLRDLHTTPLRLLIGEHSLELVAAGLALLVLAVSVLLLLRHARRGRQDPGAPLAIVLALGAGLLGPLLYVILRDFPLLPRHLMFAWPALPVLQALGLLRLPRLRPALLGVVALQLMAFGNLLWNPLYGKDDERSAVRFAESRSGPATVIVGDVAFAYTTKARGLVRKLTDVGDPSTFAGATDVWLIDNRGWEDPEGRYRGRLERSMDHLGLRYAGEDGRFRGVVLRHWRREPDS